MDTVRRSFRARKYLSLQDKENHWLSTPEYVKKRPEIENIMEDVSCSACAAEQGSGKIPTGQPGPQTQKRPNNRRTSMISTSTNRGSSSNCPNTSSSFNNSTMSAGPNNRRLSRSASVRITMIDAVGTLRKKISSTAQLMSQGSLSHFSNNIANRRRSMRIAANTPPRCQHRKIKMHSPFEFATPEKCKMDRKWCDTETPTKLRREVEALTADMQALASLTPNTLRTRAATRRQKEVTPPKKGKFLTSRNRNLVSEL